MAHVDPLISAETAHGLLHLSTRLDLVHAGLLSTRSTSSQATMVYLVLTKWRLRSWNMDQSPAVFRQQPNLNKTTKREKSTVSTSNSHRSTMKSPLLDGVLTTRKRNIGLEETHGVPTGETTVSSWWRCTPTTLPLKLIALLESLPSPRLPDLTPLFNDH
jgi:hypothetical protein